MPDGVNASCKHHFSVCTNVQDAVGIVSHPHLHARLAYTSPILTAHYSALTICAIASTSFASECMQFHDAMETSQGSTWAI